MGNVKQIGIAITVLIFLGGIGALALAAPNLDISMYKTRTNTFSQIDTEITLKGEEHRFSQWTPVCFRITNIGQSLGSTDTPANNFAVGITTNAICKNCELNTNFGTLAAQQSQDICRDVKVPSDLETLTFQINPYYNYLIFSPGKQKTFSCELLEEKESEYQYSCDLE